MKFPTRLIAIISIFGSFNFSASAHNLPVSNMSIVSDSDALHVELVFNANELSFFPEIDTNNDGLAGLKEVEAKNEQISKSIVENFTFVIGDKPVLASSFGVIAELGTHHLTLRAHYPIDARELPVQVTSRLAAITQRTHIVEVTFKRPERRQSARLDAHNSQVVFDYGKKTETSESPIPSSSKDLGPLKSVLIVGLLSLIWRVFIFRDSKFRK